MIKKRIGLIVAIIVILSSINTVFGAIYSDKNNSEYDMVIIAPERFITALQPLLMHKNSYGIKTLIKNVDEIYTEFKGRDKAEQVKYYIKYAIEKWDIKYVLLVGGRKGQSLIETWWLPVRYSYLETAGNRPENRFISDLYFADIYNKNGNFSSWDFDNDGVFGEWPNEKPAEDILDLYPDVYLGRLPCRNIFDVKIMVNKIINYEKKPANSEWFENIVVVAGDSFPEINGSYEGEEYTEKGLDFMNDFNHIKLWTSDGSLKSWIDVVKAINHGCGFLWFSGGATPISWATRLPYDSEWLYVLTLSHIPFLLNFKKLPICINGGGCHNCLFNVSIGKSYWCYKPRLPITRCMGWALTCKLFGGCIAIIGPTSTVYETPTINSEKGGIEWLDIHFFEEYNINKTEIIGETWGKTVYNYLQNFSINWDDIKSDGDRLIAKNVETWLIIGDPSLKIGGYNKSSN